MQNYTVQQHTVTMEDCFSRLFFTAKTFTSLNHSIHLCIIISVWLWFVSHVKEVTVSSGDITVFIFIIKGYKYPLKSNLQILISATLLVFLMAISAQRTNIYKVCHAVLYCTFK